MTHGIFPEFGIKKSSRNDLKYLGGGAEVWLSWGNAYLGWMKSQVQSEPPHQLSLACTGIISAFRRWGRKTELQGHPWLGGDYTGLYMGSLGGWGRRTGSSSPTWADGTEKQKVQTRSRDVSQG